MEKASEFPICLGSNQKLAFDNIPGLVDKNERGARLFLGEFFHCADCLLFGQTLGARRTGAFLDHRPLLQILVWCDVVYQRILHK